MVKISYIISTYNEAKNIAKALKSVMRQSLTDIEIIVIDDASTDATIEIVKQMATQDSRIRLIRHRQNEGLSQTRITGLQAATGEYIEFMDGNDTIRRETAERLYNNAKSNNSDIVIMGTQTISKLLRIKLPFFSPRRFFRDSTYPASKLLPHILRKQGLPFSLVDKLYRREFLLSLNLVAEKQFMGEDMLTNIRIFNSDATLSWIDYTGYNWTMGGRSSLSPVEKWESDKLLYIQCRQLLKDSNADTRDNLYYLTCGLTQSLISAIARITLNPFFSRKKLFNWVKNELYDDFWIDVCRYIPDLHASIACRDVVLTARIAIEHRKQHRFYLLSRLIP